MTTTDLLSLAERVEAASGPDRELDTDIFEAADPDGLAAWCKSPNGWQGYLPIQETDPPSLQSQRAYLEAHAPEFTESLDAAMTLCPEGWFIMLGTLPSGAVAGLSRDGQSRLEARAATPALALCAAALRALAALHPKQERDDAG